MDNIKSFLEQSDLNWTVRKEPLQTESGIIVPGHVGIVREDNNKVLSVMGDTYQPYQNHEMLETLFRVSKQTGLELKTGGHFKNGGRVYIQLKSNDLILGNDKIEGYLTGVNSFDGSTSLAFGPSNITISCMNTFFAAFRNLENKVRHTKNMGNKVDEICRGLEGMLDEEKVMFEHIKQLSQVRIGDDDVDNVLRTLFNLDKHVDIEDEEEVSTVTRNKISSFYIDLNGELKSKGDNLWGLFSGVTKYTTHSMNKGDTLKNMENKMMGEYGKRERVIFNELYELSVH